MDASVVVRGLQESLELEHELLALLDVTLLGHDRATINRLHELFPEPLIWVAHRLPWSGRLIPPGTRGLLARPLPFPFPLPQLLLLNA